MLLLIFAHQKAQIMTSEYCTAIDGTDGVVIYDNSIYAFWDDHDSLIRWEVREEYWEGLRPC